MLTYIFVARDKFLSEKIKDDLDTIARKIIEIKKILLLGSTTLAPVNYKEEMEKFLSSSSYNPQYIYKAKPLPALLGKLDSYKKEVDRLDIPQDLKEHILDFIDDQIALYRIKRSVGKKDFSENAEKLFDWGSDRLDMILTKTPNVKFKMGIEHKLQDAFDIKKRFEKVLKKYRIKGFTVQIDDTTPHIISVGYKTINIGKDIRRYKCNVDRLIIHEIESHVFQTCNMKLSPTPLSELFKYKNKHLYGEGLAIYNEIRNRKITPSAFETYFFRIKAVRNLHKSFREIFNILCEDLNPYKAFVMTYRVKRGLSDTSAPGGFAKDAVYLLGYHEIETLYAKNYNEKLMYATKSPALSTLLHKYGFIDLEKIVVPKFDE